MKPKIHVILEEAIENGVNRGWQRAHKYIDNPTEESIKEHMVDAIMGQIYEYFTFDDELHVS